MHIIDFGCTAYEDIYNEQKQLLEKRLRDDIPDTLLIGEHPPVITLGRKPKARENILRPEAVTIVDIERGGDVTAHMPGQLVAYPIVKLHTHQRDLHQFVRQLEQALISTLHSVNLEGHQRTGDTGVWVWQQQPELRELKIASIGLAVKKWVTYHGLALNVSNDMSLFQHINPCGFPSEVMTRLCDISKEPITFEQIKKIATKQLLEKLSQW